MSHTQFSPQAELVFPDLQSLESGFYIGKEEFSLLGKLYPSGIADKEGGIQRLLQLFIFPAIAVA